VGMVATMRACKAQGAASRRVRASSPESARLGLIVLPWFRYAVVLISNQALHATALGDWKKKLPLIASAVRPVSFVRSSTLIP
jgi:hypothetical protein